MPKKPEPLIIYHHPCADGMCGAWLFSKVFPNATFRGAKYGDAPPPIQKNQDVYIVDFSYPRETMIAMQKSAGSIRVFDHHKTAMQNCEGLDFCEFDMCKSGASLAFDYICKNKMIDMWDYDVRNAINMVNYVQDHDLYKHNLDSSLEINSAIQSFPLTLEAWNEIHESFRSFDALIKMGKGILQFKQTLVDEHLRKAKLVTIDNREMFGVACTCKLIVSELCHALAKKPLYEHYEYDDSDEEEYACGVGICWMDEGFNRVFSLRSLANSGIDVSKIAERYGGGGHEHAAGFEMPLV